MAKIKAAIEDFQGDPRLWDERGATRERAARAAADIHVDDKNRKYFRDTTIERALSRDIISSRQYTAANKFYLHWYRAGLADNLGTLDLDRIFGCDPLSVSSMAKTENQAFHRQQYRNAVQRIGQRGSMVLESAICRDETFEQIGIRLGWGNRAQATSAAIEILRDRLDDLCAEWGINA